jgi:predicted dienelactone hydrolase
VKRAWIFLSLLSMMPAAHGYGYQAGHVKISTADFKGHAWYPTEETRNIGQARYVPLPFTKKVSVVEDAPLPAGKAFPLVLISHGILGRETSYSWLATGLARQGYIVVSPHHDKQSREDFEEVELYRFWKRPVTVSKAIDWALAAGPFRGKVDTGEIHFIGHSVGGHTGLMLAGLPFDIGKVMDDADTGKAANNLAMRMKDSRARENPSPVDLEANRSSYKDDRIKSFIILDPTPIYPGFSEDGFRNIGKPLLYVGSSKSEIFNSDWVKAEITRLNPAIETEETQAGHFVFADRGTWLGKLMLKRVFRDPEGIDRAKIHGALLRRITGFIESRKSLDRLR